MWIIFRSWRSLPGSSRVRIRVPRQSRSTYIVEGVVCTAHVAATGPQFFFVYWWLAVRSLLEFVVDHLRYCSPQITLYRSNALHNSWTPHETQSMVHSVASVLQHVVLLVGHVEHATLLENYFFRHIYFRNTDSQLTWVGRIINCSRCDVFLALICIQPATNPLRPNLNVLPYLLKQADVALLKFPLKILELDLICLDAAFAHILESTCIIHSLSFDVQSSRTWAMMPYRAELWPLPHFWDHYCGVACVVIRILLPLISHFI